MVQGQRYVLSNLDLWDRLEKMYRQIVPEDNKCINDSGCDEEVLVNCKACEVKYEKARKFYYGDLVAIVDERYEKHINHHGIIKGTIIHTQDKYTSYEVECECGDLLHLNHLI